MNTIKKNLEEIKIIINKAKKNDDDIALIAVSKTVGVEAVKEAIDYGIINFGENKVQELLNKYEVIGDKVNWHLIGSLQTNKVKYIIDKVELIHSLDRDSLANEINKRAKEKDIIANCLIQVNISNEKTKHGLNEEDVFDFAKNINEKYGNIKIRGLMGMAPYLTDKNESRVYFRKLKRISMLLNDSNLENITMDYLSMGMSNDFDIAIEEGSNMVRIGTSIFGEREYNI